MNQGKDECRYLVVKNTIPNASSVLLRRSVFEQAGRFDEQLRLVADWMLWAKILLISDIAYIAEPLNYFRVHRKTVRSKTRGDGNHIEEYYKVLSFISDNAELPQASVEKAYNRLVNRWVNSILRLLLTKPTQAASKAQAFYRIASSLDAKVNHRLLMRFIKDISTFGLLSLRERAAQ